MTFNPLMYKVIKEITPNIPKPKEVCELGNQTFTANNTFDTTEEFYKHLGYREYNAIDINTRMGSKIVDLNYVFPIHKRYSLVTNNGTGEHIFNQAAVMENCHNLCIPGGFILHVMPFINWINHGFYNFNPILYMDLAAANNYTISRFSVANRWAEESHIPTKYEYYKPGNKPTTLFKNIKIITDQTKNRKQQDLFPNIIIVVLFRKSRNKHNLKFKFPMQGKYLKDIENAELRDVYKPD